MWKPVELQADYWIILDEDGYYEYRDEAGDNLMFTTEDEAQQKVYQINQSRRIDKEFFNRITNNLLGEKNA
jgi:hypothetical protein